MVQEHLASMITSSRRGVWGPKTTFDRAAGSGIYRILIRGSLSYNL